MNDSSQTTRKALVTGGAGFIGRHLIAHLRSRGWWVASFDLLTGSPADVEYVGNILDAHDFRAAVESEAPVAIFHLAARTDTYSNDVAEYDVNVTGTANVLRVANAVPSVEYFIHTSTQYVASPGADISADDAYSPFTAYGESKALSEQLVRREVDPRLRWAIIRPTNIWGAGHPRYPQEFWRVVDRGLYLHPGTAPVIRTYGYVENVAWQIVEITERLESLSSRVFYLGDTPIELGAWVDAFSTEIRGHRARRVPTTVVKSLALLGDVVAKFGIRVPITSSRYRSMTEDYVVPTELTERTLGRAPFTMDDGVRRTVGWLRQNGLVKSRERLPR